MLDTLLLWRKLNRNFAGMQESLFCFVLINWHGGRIIEASISQQLENRKGVRESRPCVSRDGTGMTMVMQRSSAGAQKRRKKAKGDLGLAGIVTVTIHLCAVVYYFLCIPADGCSLLPDGPSSRTWLNLQQVNIGADDTAPSLRNPDTRPRHRRHRTRSCTAELVQKEGKKKRQLDSSTQRLKRKQAVAQARRGEKKKSIADRYGANATNLQRRVHGALRGSGAVYNSPDKCRKCEAVSQKKPRWTEKRLQYDLFREA